MTDAHRIEARALMHEVVPRAAALGPENKLTLDLRWLYAMTLYRDDAATLDDVREAVTTLEETERIARRVLGGAHPVTMGIGRDLQKSRAALRARETPGSA